MFTLAYIEFGSVAHYIVLTPVLLLLYWLFAKVSCSYVLLEA